MKGAQRRENMNKEEEAVFLAPFLAEAAHDGIMVAGEIKRALDARHGTHVPLSSVYNLLHPRDWRKLAPGKGHPQRPKPILCPIPRGIVVMPN
jgi:hypothetical protein